MVRITDYPEMSIVIYQAHKPTRQPQQLMSLYILFFDKMSLVCKKYATSVNEKCIFLAFYLFFYYYYFFFLIKFLSHLKLVHMNPGRFGPVPLWLGRFGPISWVSRLGLFLLFMEFG